MKRIIDGKLYNTETATKICELPCTAYQGDFRYHNTSLFRTKHGAYFIAGRGGAMSMWGRPCGDNASTGGDGLRVVSQDEAREIAESAELDAEKMIAAGFEIEEG